MKILLVHQNFPGQFKHLVPALLADAANEVVAFTMNPCQEMPGLKVVRYAAAKGTAKDVHPWVADTETKVIRGEAAFLAAMALKNEGFEPDVILAHPGWGESLFLKEVWPHSKLIIYSEFHYAAEGTDVGFDPEFPPKDVGDCCRVRLKNVNNLLHFDIADAGVSRKDQRKLDAENRRKYKPLYDALKKAEDAVEKFPAEQKQLEQQLSDPAIYEDSEKAR